MKVRGGQKDELGKLLPELVLSTAPNFRGYLYTEVRLSTPTLSALLPLAGKNMPVLIWVIIMAALVAYIQLLEFYRSNQKQIST